MAPRVEVEPIHHGTNLGCRFYRMTSSRFVLSTLALVTSSILNYSSDLRGRTYCLVVVFRNEYVSLPNFVSDKAVLLGGLLDSAMRYSAL
jgi:hypothetical protein